MSAVNMDAGNYRYIPGVMQYSAGVAAAEGHAIERVRFADPVPMAEGFERIAAYLESIGRPKTAFCACELRSPGQFTEEGFTAFNSAYAKVLRDWGIMEGDVNPVARANVCPEVGAPSEPSFHAFAYTVEQAGAPATFVIAGSGEAPEGKGNYADHIVRPGDTSVDGLREKAAFVLGEMERRMGFFGAGWSDVTGTQVYTVHDFHPFVLDQIAERGAARHGITWHVNRPPVVGLDFEMDCRRVLVERVLA